MRSAPTGCKTRLASAESSFLNETSRLAPAGGSARQLSAFSNSAFNSGITAMGGNVVSRDSPQVKSKSAEISKKSSEIEPLPLARQGVGPSSEKRKRMLNSPTPKALSETEAEISMMK